MNNKIYGLIGTLLLLATPFFLMGCASEPVHINWPANHPVSPETQEAEFIRPQNPFETDMAVMKEAPDNDSMLKHTMPQESGMQHMDHDMGTDTRKNMDSESKMKPEHREDHKQHQEHSQ